MRNFRGGLMTGAATAALGFVDLSLCSIDDGGAAAGGGGGAAGLLDDDAGAAGAGGGGDDDAAAAAAAAAAAKGEPPAVADWMKGFSGEKAGEEPSNQEWLASIGVKDLDGLAKIARDNQKALRESGRVKIPGENASDADWAAFREAVGAPKEAAAYEVTMPEDAKEFELETAFIDPLKEIAFKHGIPAAAFKELGDAFLADAMKDAKAEVVRLDNEAAEKVKEWGINAPQRKEEFRRGAELLGLNKADIASIQREFGAGKTLDMFAKIGQLAGEDFFAGGDPATKFGVANLEQAQKALNALGEDAEFRKKLDKKDSGAVAKWNAAIEAVSTFKQHENRRR